MEMTGGASYPVAGRDAYGLSSQAYLKLRKNCQARTKRHELKNMRHTLSTWLVNVAGVSVGYCNMDLDQPEILHVKRHADHYTTG